MSTVASLANIMAVQRVTEAKRPMNRTRCSRWLMVRCTTTCTPTVAAPRSLPHPQPMNQGGFEYGQVGMAIRLDSETGPQNYKIAFLMWPTTGAWTNEVDFAETQPALGDDISVNSLLSNNAPNFDMTDGNQDTGVNLNGW